MLAAGKRVNDPFVHPGQPQFFQGSLDPFRGKVGVLPLLLAKLQFFFDRHVEVLVRGVLKDEADLAGVWGRLGLFDFLALVGNRT